ncbi:hypothetical protein [Cryptosporangium japonicum]|uniref:Uncharacterized protein n=1 Tax=Cryptosporangium japonicum TaxID=80872 RepID=A0ABP3E893_9ACTN
MDLLLAALRESATPALYRRNTFRLTGLPTGADRRTVRERRQKVLTRLEVGADVDGAAVDGAAVDGAAADGAGADRREVARAFDLILGDPRRRLVDELFWYWDGDTTACSCPSTLHRDHDEAVLSHREVLEREARSVQLSDGERRELDEDWADAAAEWASVLRRVAFFDHVRHRIAVLDDKQLDESALDVIRDELPLVLVKPLVLLAAGSPDRPARLRAAALAWPAPRDQVLDLLEQSAEPLYDDVTAALQEARDALESNRPLAAATALSTSAVPRLARLDALAPAAEHRRTSRTRNDVAIAFNNCAVQDIDTRGAPAEQAARRWLGTAKSLATDADTRTAITRNTEYVGQVVLAERRRGVPREAEWTPAPPTPVSGAGCLLWLVLVVLLALFLIWVNR